MNSLASYYFIYYIEPHTQVVKYPTHQHPLGVMRCKPQSKGVWLDHILNNNNNNNNIELSRIVHILDLFRRDQLYADIGRRHLNKQPVFILLEYSITIE